MHVSVSQHRSGRLQISSRDPRGQDHHSKGWTISCFAIKFAIFSARIRYISQMLFQDLFVMWVRNILSSKRSTFVFKALYSKFCWSLFAHGIEYSKRNDYFYQRICFASFPISIFANILVTELKSQKRKMTLSTDPSICLRLSVFFAQRCTTFENQ